MRCFPPICILIRQYKCHPTENVTETNEMLIDHEKMTNLKATMLFLQNCIHIVSMSYILDLVCQYVSASLIRV